MMKTNNFACFILSYGRANNNPTYTNLRKSGYTGKIFIIISSDDKTKKEYYSKYENVIEFDKKDMEQKFDKLDNFGNYKCVVYARNKSFEIAKELSLDYFCMLDDDYTSFEFTENHQGQYVRGKTIQNLDRVFDSMIYYVSNTNIKALCFAQGGDFIGGDSCGVWKSVMRRKAMNLYIFKTDRPVVFPGTINEDTNMYVNYGNVGELFFTIRMLRLEQKQTQSNSGGLTDIYLESGTYVKSFYTVMMRPASAEIRIMGNKYNRLHHFIKWKNTVPCIIDEKYKKL